jgi:hypothetical protein
MSDDEKGLIYPAEWLGKITDIREQYPLLDVDLCLAIAEKMTLTTITTLSMMLLIY